MRRKLYLDIVYLGHRPERNLVGLYHKPSSSVGLIYIMYFITQVVVSVVFTLNLEWILTFCSLDHNILCHKKASVAIALLTSPLAFLKINNCILCVMCSYNISTTNSAWLDLYLICTRVLFLSRSQPGIVFSKYW